MSPDEPGIVVVGASLAGLRGAEALRRGGYAGPLTLVGDEPHAPYDRPPLSKHVLAGELRPDATALPHLADLDATWRLGQPAVGLDRSARVLRLADGVELRYEKLLIATGAQARPWPVTDGSGPLPSGIHTLRSRDDAAALRIALAAGPKRVLIVGGGLIGCEAASCCRDLGLAVTLADPNPTPLARILGSLIGSVIVSCMNTAGVDFRPGTHVEAFEADASGRVCRARLKDGAAIETDCVIVALGATRDTSWLAEAGLNADAGGLTCDSACRALDSEGRPAPGLYAAGDVARCPSPFYGGRLVAFEHWGNAVAQAGHAARNMLANDDDQRAYRHLPSFWSSQFGINIKGVGLADGADAVAVVQGSRASRRFLAVYGREGRAIAAISFDQARWLPAYAERIEAGAAFPPILGATDQSIKDFGAPDFPEPRSR
ncbi:NAD(P)/FAD-dependent oxidoreductase [Methylobacterium haplocladii]|uniref:Pyridine nucleotide-disulfide oxidoreductase n=1 Tax=Methylobacterium haplocladii TaxID=1176176 RepID=A0A512IQJ1_9HYPH|nr:FAD-dependent oxidoreductase [Methylobacterium haplocladii]GEO99950.1 pyridine nucleotide-disulfide oxidoreductase [Methylobacterium haplocladii]GJD86219.1 Dicamba O-demethylase 1, ferredoxin reductase component [Methylobacterium haplocladii]GLS59664.1 pyridine nucleotide-disulfide oxidoreductase [Methylobacterium haplocladii]